jgi:hypothetical protein
MAYNRELSQFASLVEVNNTSKRIGLSTDLNVSGIITASQFFGSGRFLTDIVTTNVPGGTEGQLQYNDGNSTEGAEIYYDSITQNVGIGTTNPSTLLDVNGSITCIDINSTSDLNLKENIKTVENALDTISQLRGVTFDWKENSKPSIGVIAQELEEVLPQLVNNGEVKSVNYNGIIGVLIEAVKELKKEIEELKNTK